MTLSKNPFTRAAHWILARLGVWLLSLRRPLTGYGLYFVFRYGSERQAEFYLNEAMEARTRPVLLVPVMTDAGGVPAPSGKGEGLVN